MVEDCDRVNSPPAVKAIPDDYIGFFVLGLMDHDRYIERAFQLALLGRGSVSPNPRVGALVVDENGKILAEGWHKRFGGPHAEVEALSQLTDGKAAGKSLYVTLEPCAHHHHTPPCTDAIIKAGIKKVFASSIDPYPQVNGKGFEKLRKTGIEVTIVGSSSYAREINRGFFTWVEKGRAWCEAKIALSLDGKMAGADGTSKWISGEKSRRLAHRLRSDLDAVLVGSGTVKSDNPELTVRTVKGPNPVRLILGKGDSIPASSKLALSAGSVRTLMIHSDTLSPPDGVVDLKIEADSSGKIDPLAILKKLPEIGILSVLIEGGAGVLSSFMTADVIDRITIAYSPSVIGTGISPFEQFVPASWMDRPFYHVESSRRLGDDVIVQYSRREPSLQVW